LRTTSRSPCSCAGSERATREGTLHNPPPRQNHEPSWRHQLLPINFLWPSLAHSSCAQIRATSSGMGLGGRRTISTLRPSTFSTQSLPRPWGTLHRATGEKGARSQSAHRLQQQPQSVSVGDLGAHDLGFEDQTLGVHQQLLTLPATHLLSAVIASVFTTDTGGLGRLGVDYPGARSSVPTQAGSQPLPKRRVKLLPGVPSIRHLLK